MKCTGLPIHGRFYFNYKTDHLHLPCCPGEAEQEVLGQGEDDPGKDDKGGTKFRLPRAGPAWRTVTGIQILIVKSTRAVSEGRAFSALEALDACLVQDKHEGLIGLCYFLNLFICLALLGLSRGAWASP